MTTIEDEIFVEQITDSVARIELPLPLDDLHIVNAYAVLGTDGVTLVDPGWSSEAGERALLGGLATLGASRTDVRRVLVTHSHPDHFTLASAWQRDHGIPVHLGVGEQPSVTMFTTATTRFPRQAELLLRAGAGALSAAIQHLELLDQERDMAWIHPARWLDDREVIDCGGNLVQAVATPGHTRGHMVYRDLASGAFFTGDHVLPRITPSIGFELEPEGPALRNYLASLELLLTFEDGPMLPAHGPVTDSVHARVKELLAHHDERFATIRAHVSAGRTTAGEVAEAMTWTRHDRTLDQLNDIHRMTAIVEVLAHLDLMAERGMLGRTEADGVDRFAA